MKLLIDVNNLIYASFFRTIAILKSDFTPGMVYHLFFNKLFMLKRKFKVDNRNIVLAFDHKIMWRRKYFQYYKLKRKEMREKSDIDFKKLFEILENVYSFLLNNCSFITLRHQYLECDDWIGVLVKHYQGEDIVIISTDKDFYQCHSNLVKQYDNINGKYIVINNAKIELLLKILNGDKDDGIPNILSDGDTFMVKEKRQKCLGESKVLGLIRDKKVRSFITENNCIGNFKRNEKLISFEMIPDKIKKLIVDKVNRYEIKRNKMKVMSFLHNNELNQVLGNINLLIE